MAEAMAGASATAAAEVLCFRIAAEQWALPAAAVAEIIRLRPVTRLPQGPASLLGILNLRGGILPVVSLAGLLGLAQAAPSPASRIIVLQQGQRVGLLVDAVTSLEPAAGQRQVEVAALLARDFSRAMRRTAAPRAAAPMAGPAAGRDDTLALIGITLAGQHYALPLDGVLEVARMPADVTGLPAVDSAMAGVMPFRDRLLPLVSLRALLGLPAPPPDRREARIVVTRIGAGGHRVGLVVDALQAILRVPGEAVDPVPAVLTRGTGEARIEAIARLDGGRQLVSILSTESLFDPATASRLSAGADQEGRAMTTEAKAAEAQREAGQFVLFRLGEEHYGLPVAMVDEVVRRPPSLTRIPRAPAFLLGVMNLRGRVVPVIDQRRRFEVAGPAAGIGIRGRIVIVTIDGLQAGFAVDSASELRSIAASEIEPVPELGDAGAQVFDRIATLAEDGRMVLLIEPRALLDRAERDLLASIAADLPPAVSPA